MRIVIYQYLGQITEISEWAGRGLQGKHLQKTVLCTHGAHVGIFTFNHKLVLRSQRSPLQDHSQLASQDGWCFCFLIEWAGQAGSPSLSLWYYGLTQCGLPP